MEMLALTFCMRYLGSPGPSRPLPDWWGKAAHSLFLEALRGVDAPLASSLHTPTTTRALPFTTSTLLGHTSGKSLNPAQEYRLRCTALNATTCAALEQAAASGLLHLGSEVELDYHRFTITGEVDRQEADYQELSSRYLRQPQTAENQGLPDDQVRLRFLSPVCFHSGRLNQPLPLPHFVFGSLLLKWNAFSPLKLAEELRDFTEANLALSRFELASRSVRVGGGMQIGATGSATYRLEHQDRYWLSALNILADYCTFAGVGAKTTMGLGQTRRE